MHSEHPAYGQPHVSASSGIFWQKLCYLPARAANLSYTVSRNCLRNFPASQPVLWWPWLRNCPSTADWDTETGETPTCTELGPWTGSECWYQCLLAENQLQIFQHWPLFPLLCASRAPPPGWPRPSLTWSLAHSLSLCISHSGTTHLTVPHWLPASPSPWPACTTTTPDTARLPTLGDFYAIFTVVRGAGRGSGSAHLCLTGTDKTCQL